MRCRSEDLAHFRLAEMPGIDQQGIIDKYAFFLDGPAFGWHRSRCNPADIRMMPARGHERAGFGSIVFEENGDDHCDIGKVGPAAIGIVEHIGITPPEAAPVASVAPRFDNAGDTVAHRP